MSRVCDATLLSSVEAYFRGYLIQTRGTSAHTIRAYRDTLRLLFRFLADRRNCPVAELTLDDLHVDAILAFLAHLETVRANSVASRNARLAAIRSFFRHLVEHDLPRAGQYQRVLSIPNKRAHLGAAQYLEPPDVKSLLTQPDRTTTAGRRDYALMLFLYNTGARISEALGVRAEHLSLILPRRVRLFGKGGKERLCPLWHETTEALAQLLAVGSDSPEGYVFCNRNGQQLTRDGAAYLLRKYAGMAVRTCPQLRRRRITPHVLRHSCAVALLQAGVDITVIRDYLGHASITTTSRYVATNLQMKRDALELFWSRSGLLPTRPRPWKPKPDVLTYLASVGSTPHYYPEQSDCETRK
ncbi:MAG: site-specific integrase [Pseudomonadales bacterium]|jgi:integrase/recombinase XerD|nr:site-specific integrase [Pseudomonadales bacterium]MCP5319663.1 site-specific integrase [Pseudomonadales bacterium]MCP5337405.1 site-specific integrase [Pseudomonadales bacterium]